MLLNNTILNEIESAMMMTLGLSCRISFFDTQVTEPVLLSSPEELKSLHPPGGGGTSFHSIFQFMKEKMMDQLPSAIIIMTDGKAKYPLEQQALGVPVLWILVGQNEDAPWGRTIHIR